MPFSVAAATADGGYSDGRSAMARSILGWSLAFGIAGAAAVLSFYCGQGSPLAAQLVLVLGGVCGMAVRRWFVLPRLSRHLRIEIVSFPAIVFGLALLIVANRSYLQASGFLPRLLWLASPETIPLHAAGGGVVYEAVPSIDGGALASFLARLFACAGALAGGASVMRSRSRGRSTVVAAAIISIGWAIGWAVAASSFSMTTYASYVMVGSVVAAIGKAWGTRTVVQVAALSMSGAVGGALSGLQAGAIIVPVEKVTSRVR
jgi:hypothetical protein